MMNSVIHWSEFSSRAATDILRHEGAWGELAQRLREARGYSNKDACPWVKLATFGNTRTEKKSLRHDANVTQITGVEGDYDGERIPPETALEKLERAGIRAIVYTSPSHTPDKPRWRVLAPLSRPLSPADRTRMLARVNGALEGVLSGESFTLSQSYYYGQVDDAVDYKVLVTFDDPDEGQHVDELDSLDEIAVGKPNGAKPSTSSDAEPVAPPGEHEFAELVQKKGRKLKTGDGRRELLKRYIASRSARGLRSDDIRVLIDGIAARYFEPADPLNEADVQGVIAWATRRDSSSVTPDDFVSYLPAHHYIFIPTREPWPASSVDSRVTWPKGIDGKAIKPSAWLDQNNPVEQMTWAPGEPMLIKNRLIAAGGWIKRNGCTTFNLYRPPEIVPGNAKDVEPWLSHIVRVYGEATDHIVDWLAQRVQRPAVKINHALVLGGAQGIGKDTILEPVKGAVGPWNFSEASPGQVLGRFNGFVKSVILRISEARDLGDVDRYAFYDHMKVYTAAPPDVLRCDEKHLREHAVFNVTGVIITSNHKSDGIYLPADDRRHFVAWSSLTKDDFAPDYWRTLYAWYAAGGAANVAAYLQSRDLSAFDPKAPPPKTDAFYEIVSANRAPEDGELADVLDTLKWPQAVTLNQLVAAAGNVNSYDFADFLKDRRNRRIIPHRLEAAGYVPVRNPDDRHDGQWRVEGKRQTVYARRELSTRDQITAARGLR